MPGAFLSLVAQTVLSQVTVVLYNLADSFFVGQIGDPAQLADLPVAFPVFNIMIAFANVFGIGANGAIARNLGAGDAGRAKRASATGFW